MEFLANLPLLSLFLLGLIALMTLWFAGPGYSSHSAPHSPTILTSTGIFGTFLGVALGLLHFDTANIQDSVPELIGGLRTAFWTSIAGLLGALIVKFRHLASTLKQGRLREQFRAATTTDLANLLADIRDSLNSPEGQGLRAAVESLRREQASNFSSLVQTVTEFEQRRLENQTELLVGALEKVMRDFNAEINAQYGDNFVQLNQAVGQMLDWQKSYRAELERLLASQQSNGELLDRASSAYQQMVEHAEVFKQVSESLGTMLSSLQQQSQGLDQYLIQLAEVASKASEGLPSLEGRVHQLTDGLVESLNYAQQQVTQSQQQLNQQYQQMLSGVSQQVGNLEVAMEEQLTQSLSTFGYQLASLSEKFVHDYTPLTQKLQELVRLSELGQLAADQTAGNARETA